MIHHSLVFNDKICLIPPHCHLNLSLFSSLHRSVFEAIKIQSFNVQLHSAHIPQLILQLSIDNLTQRYIGNFEMLLQEADYASYLLTISIDLE